MILTNLLVSNKCDKYEKFLSTPGEHREMMLIFLIFIMDLIMNLMSKSHHECKRIKYHSPYSKST